MNTTNTEVKRGAEEWSALCEIVKMPKEPTTMNTYKQIEPRNGHIFDQREAERDLAEEKSEITYPDCYLHVEECRSGETWIQPIPSNAHLDIKRQVKKWIKNQFGGELKLDGELIPRLQGDYYARIITDGRSPDSIVCWTSGGFYLK